MAILDPVRVAEDHATLDQISRGWIELVIGEGEIIDWEGEFKPSLKDVTTVPRPYAGVPRIWHGSARRSRRWSAGPRRPRCGTARKRG